ncbi:MAG: extracellular solute-binding protein [Devosia sp.]|nr:extracellular solute-binding protein [Devosia sp.]
MLKRHLLAATAAVAILAGAAGPVLADMSIEYMDSFAPLVESGVANYEKATGQKVTLVRLPDDGYQNRVALDLASGSAPDLILVDSFLVSEYAGSGYLAPLNDMLKGWDQFKNYSKGLLDVASYNGHVYGLPTDTDVRMLWYNRADFAKAGIADPWQPKSWADIIAAAEKLKAAGVPDAFVIPAGTKQEEATTMQGVYMALLGADKPEGDRNRLRVRDQDKWIGDSPALRKTLALYKEVYVDKKLADGSVNYTLDTAGVNKAMLDGTFGIFASGSWQNACFWGCDGKNAPSQAERDKLVAWTPWPGNGEPGNKTTTNISGGWTIDINAKAADKAAAFKLLTTIFDEKSFEDWTVANHRMAVRSDIASSAAYTADPYLAKATALAADTTGRDTVPGYQKVSALIQQATAEILDGKSVDDVVKEYHDALVDEFGADKVVTLN